MKRRQAWRDHNKEIATLIEDVIVDKMNSGWNTANARFMEYVEERNIAEGDANEFFVEDDSLLTVSKFSGIITTLYVRQLSLARRFLLIHHSIV